eukprot:TRINITY_DN15545_c1_g1_i1.p1 TRINITY_DN15545_c1_g1~~TRINITY_DN15545_c1_g1_i1.p1  ORF type:complete len:203 (-),score=27.55 TRINITY_DN15545_c1_g1_i1:1412-2020(-)
MDCVDDIIHENSWSIPRVLPADLQDFLNHATSGILLGDCSLSDTPSWLDSSSCNLSLKATWNLLKTSATKLPWTGLICNKFVNPRLACFSWRLLHRKTPTDYLAKNRGSYMASRCYNCLFSEESDHHRFFFSNMAQPLWYWLLKPCGIPPSFPLTATAIWGGISADRDVSGRKCSAAIFFHAISILWLHRNDLEHNNSTAFN